MAIERSLFTTQELIGVYRDLRPITPFWLNFFPGLYRSDSEFIEWSKIIDHRHLAPLVLPTQQGRPTYKPNESLYRVKPGYLKPKDSVMAADMGTIQAGLGEIGRTQPLTPQQRYNAAVGQRLQTHRSTIENRWEWMAAQAILFGQITLVDDGYPKAVVDFQRAAGHTVTLGVGARWGDSGVSPMDLLEAWGDTMADAKFGGPVTDIIMGAKAWKAFKADPEVQALLNKDIRNTSGTSFDLGMGNGDKIQRKGSISSNVSVWVYSDYYEDPDGTVVPFMDPRDVLLMNASRVMGVKAFGIIYDKKANFATADVFPKMWDQEDPSATMLMTQSAPLMVPINPNATFRARVVA